MIKILHGADLHLDSAFVGRSDGATDRLRTELRAVPGKIAGLCRQEQCDLLLLAGDVFDGEYSKESFLLLKSALEEVAIPVFIAPGNHDFYGPGSPWTREVWPKNVHIFINPQVESVSLPELDCRVYGGGFTGMDCPSMLENFQIHGKEKYHIGVFHGDPTQSNSPYNAVTLNQVEGTGLDYLALGHIHRMGMLRTEKTLCGWPGCPMGRGFDETEEKGVLVVAIDQTAHAKFVPLDVPRFYQFTDVPVETTPEDAVAARLPALGNQHFYRIYLTGEAEKPNLDQLYQRFSAFPNLELRDMTQPQVDIWRAVGTDSLEGTYFQMLHELYQQGDEPTGRAALLAAKLSRKMLDGIEVKLP